MNYLKGSRNVRVKGFFNGSGKKSELEFYSELSPCELIKVSDNDGQITMDREQVYSHSIVAGGLLEIS